ncbi:universal stress protein [Halomonas piscis]|uniref:Universal stress protein n=1 Tax=Halomonas piscis TaxID=3031727 RepID=A0ABY9Z4A6_9GAMM|nr:universal stress protein [Halomonas piscis]WNK21148.1 universal stress protein [Halomonas piscis]
MYHKILLAIDSEDDGEGKRSLEEGVKLLSEDGELLLGTVCNPGGAGFFPHVTPEKPEEREKEARENLRLLVRKYLPMAMQDGVTLHVAAGKPAEKLVALAAKTCVDLIILVSKGAGSSRWPMRRATIEYVVTNAPCSVLVLPTLMKATDETSESDER